MARRNFEPLNPPSKGHHMSDLNNIRTKALGFVSLLNQHDRNVTQTPVGMDNFDERPVFYSQGGAITYTNGKHTYWGAAMGCLATVIKEMSEVLDVALNMPHNTLELRNDPHIECLIMKSARHSNRYSATTDNHSVELGNYEIDDSSRSDFLNFPCIINDFDFKHFENTNVGSLNNAINAMRVIDSYNLFVSTLGENGKAYPYLKELTSNNVSEFVLVLLEQKLSKLLDEANLFMSRIAAHRVNL